MTKKEELIQKIKAILEKNTEDKEEVKISVYAGINGNKYGIGSICQDSQYWPDRCIVFYEYGAYQAFKGISDVSNEGLREILKQLKTKF